MKAFGFKKSERLRSKKLIAEIFKRKNVLYVFPFSVHYLKGSFNQENTLQFAISVPKRNFKRAVDRNLIKRRTREAYRLNKHLLLPHIANQHQLLIFVLYQSKKIESFDKIQRSMLDLIQKLVAKND